MSEVAAKPTRGGLRNRVIVLLAVGVAVGGIRYAVQTDQARKNQFRHNGETAREWFYKLPHNGSVIEREIEAAWQVLGTNFFPICIEHLHKGKRLPMARRYAYVYFRCPKLFQRCLPTPNVVNIRNEAHAAFWTLQGVAKCHPTVLEELQMHMDPLNDYAENSEFSEDANRLLFLIRAGEREVGTAPHHIDSTDFFVRVYASVTTVVCNWTNEVALKDCVPALIEAVTNRPAMEREFRAIAGRLRQNAMESLEKISPQAAAEYSKYLD